MKLFLFHARNNIKIWIQHRFLAFNSKFYYSALLPQDCLLAMIYLIFFFFFCIHYIGAFIHFAEKLRENELFFNHLVLRLFISIAYQRAQFSSHLGYNVTKILEIKLFLLISFSKASSSAQKKKTNIHIHI